MSLEPTLQGVPSSAASPHGTITLSSVSVQYSSQGSAERFKRLDIFYLSWYPHRDLWLVFENISLTLIEVGQPGVVLPLVLLSIIVAALNAPETRCTIGTRFDIADFVSTSLTDTESSSIGRLGMIALSFHDWYSSPTASGTLAPGTPLAPSTINLSWFVHDRDAFLILAPL